MWNTITSARTEAVFAAGGDDKPMEVFGEPSVVQRLHRQRYGR